MPEFLGITKASTRCTGGSAARRRRPAGCRWGSPSAWGGHHGFERGRQLAALSPNRPALRGLPAWPEAPKKPARLDQEQRQPSSDGEGTVVPPSLAIRVPPLLPKQLRPTGPPRRVQMQALGHRSQAWPCPRGGRFGPGGWAVPSVLGERQGQGGLEGGFLIDTVVHKSVIGELVPVEQVLQEVGALVARVTPGHR